MFRRKIGSIYGLRISKIDINKHIQEIYGVNVFAEIISKSKDKITYLVKE